MPAIHDGSGGLARAIAGRRISTATIGTRAEIPRCRKQRSPGDDIGCRGHAVRITRLPSSSDQKRNVRGTLHGFACHCQEDASTQNSGYRRAPRGSEVTVTHSAEEGTVTRASLREYATRQRARYEQAGRRQKQALLDEIVAVTGMHRKAAIRLLRRPLRSAPAPSRAGRPRQYGPEVAAAVELLWQASGRIGAHRLHPFVPELLDRLLRWDELRLSPAIEKLVRQASRPTLARLLAPARKQYPLRGASTTQPSSWLKQQIPLRTFARLGRGRARLLRDRPGGSLRVEHRGLLPLHALRRRYRHELGRAASGLGKGQHRVTAAIHEVRQRLPVPLRALDSDNGSEFINQTLYGYCVREGITFTRSRAWKKNDSAHVEQKNGAVVRHLIGYDRFASQRAYAQLARVYALARLHVNFFQPVEKLVSKQRTGARVRRVFDRPQTPYQRLCAAGVLLPATRDELKTLYQRLNPLQLQRELEAALDRLWALAASDPHRPSSPPLSVTLTSELTGLGG